MPVVLLESRPNTFASEGDLFWDLKVSFDLEQNRLFLILFPFLGIFILAEISLLLEFCELYAVCFWYMIGNSKF